jgi:hypothetical protein
MTSINPFSGYVAQGTQVERAQVTDKTRQIRRTQELSKNVALRDDEMEHQVESSDTVGSATDDQGSGQPSQQQHKRQSEPDADGDDRPHIDLTA